MHCVELAPQKEVDLLAAVLSQGERLLRGSVLEKADNPQSTSIRTHAYVSPVELERNPNFVVDNSVAEHLLGDALPSGGRSRGSCVELCCGAGRLTAALARAGFDSMGVDLPRSRHKHSHSWIALDLADAADQAHLLTLLFAAPRLQLVWVSVPSATFSAARSVPLSSAVAASTVEASRPVRSKEFPAGLTNELDHAQLKKLQWGNAVADFTLKVLSLATSRGARWIVENPKSSLLWFCPGFQELVSNNSSVAEFAACSFGGGRPKVTRLVSNWRAVQALSKPCTRDHDHLPWNEGAKDFNSHHPSSESEYTAQFSGVVADLIATECEELATESSDGAFFQAAVCAATRAALGIQPRGNALAQLLPEYAHISSVASPSPNVVGMNNVLLKDILTTDGIIPKGSKLLHPLYDMGPGGQVSIGHPWVAADFLSAAKKVKHPFTAFVSPDDRCTRAIFALLTEGADAITRRRESTIARWTRRAAELRSQEDSRLRSLHPDVQKVIGPDGFARKSVLLLHEIMKEVGFPGADAVTAIHEEGVLLFGPCPEFHCFPRRGRRALKDINELRRFVRRVRRSGFVRQVGARSQPGPHEGPFHFV